MLYCGRFEEDILHEPYLTPSLPASTLVDLTFQSRALRSFSLNQLRNLSL